ncbi:prospero homeobox protein 1-like [Salvelinus namaycush]|uniref:Prospero homeobox protein 1-like n=1 Tax=Salvelinus namaycush TaxID=8040 RepID=A0A8U0Q7Q2_SALNM|nr:prospero homeobox protein 1-like [Salvelinus namaycush]
MEPSLLDHSMNHYSSSTYPEDRTENPPSFLHSSSSPQSSGGSLMSTLLQTTIESKRTLQESTTAYYPPDAPMSSSAATNLNQVDHHSSSTTMAPLSPASQASTGATMAPLSPASQASTGASPTRFRLNEPGLTQDWMLELVDRHRAKRARVENIIRGMAGSPLSVYFTGEGFGEGETTPTSHLQSETLENKRKQRVPQHQDVPRTGGVSRKSTDEGHTLRKQLQTMQTLLGQLQARFIQVYENQSEEEDHHSTWNKEYVETKTSPGEVFLDPYSEFNNKTPLDKGHLGWMNNKQTDYLHSNPDNEDKLLADILKYELSRAVNSSVDSIFKNISHTFVKSPQLHVEDGGMVETDDETVFLSSREPASTSTRPPFLYNHPTALQENHQVLDNLKHNSSHHDTFGGLQCKPSTMGLSTPEIVDLPWDPVVVRSKGTSRPSGSPQAHQPMATGHRVLLDSLGLPHIKMDCGSFQSMVKRTSYVLNVSFSREGLTTQHLKKAKLMFFYTRYPSSNVLKTFFSDVQLTRCITSQLIKWFSNFREFYYIQMEKFARQARVEGVNSARDVAVSRDSELFRALNMHYNKANDFQVPDRFLEVAEITLQEFYIAISLARDSDPSWKKVIYKVICKLDSDVPAEFKAPFTT